MIRDTLTIVGPGGIGKGPLDGIIKKDALRIDPYRLRGSGPRDQKDLFYAHPKLRDELYLTFQRLGLGLTCLSEDVHWFPQAMTLFLRVRKDWQVLFLEGLDGEIAKAEIYAPALLVLLSNPQIRHVFGRLSMVVLNPVDALATLATLDELKRKTQKNCQLRGDSPASAEERAASAGEEAPAWRQMIELGATEYPNWPFPEHVYKTKRVIKSSFHVFGRQVPVFVPGTSCYLLRDRKEKLLRARQTLLARNPCLEVFFKTEDEIRNKE